jgi:molecular chaperone GrpE (heat shock protein)
MTAIRDSVAAMAGTAPQTQAALSQIHHALEEVVEDNVALTRSLKGVSDAQDTLRSAVVRELDLLRTEVGGELQVQALRQCCQELSPVLSVLERLVSDGDLSDAETTRQHLVSLAMTLRAGLGRLGIEQVPVTAGTDLFDSRVHECVRRCAPAESPMPDAARGVIVHVQEPGYAVRGRTVRSAQVWVQASETDDQAAKGAQS